jgi:5-methylcytosine-specific restriction protein A
MSLQQGGSETLNINERPLFNANATYTRGDVLAALGLPDPGGGQWYTGLARQGDDHFIFCGVGVGGRTGHNYENHFDGPDLEWRGRTGSSVHQPSIQALLNGTGKVHVFFRDDDRAPFTYAGIARAIAVRDTTPVEVRWSFRQDSGPHPEYLPDEVDAGGDVIEGAKRTVTVNAYERNPAARARCIRRWGNACVVCGFDFAAVYGSIGDRYIHVHHLRPLAVIGVEYVLDPENDLRPVCPNCHAMLHRVHPVLTIESLMARIQRKQAAQAMTR